MCCAHKHHGTAPEEQPQTQEALLGKKKIVELVFAAVDSDWEGLCKPNICTLNKKLKAMPLISLMFALMTVPVKLCTCHLI